MYYFDANALWKYYCDEKGDLNIRRLVSRSKVLVSPLTLLEFFGVLMKHYRQKKIKRKDIRSITKRIRRDASTNKTNRAFQVIPIPPDSFREAEGILLQYGRYAFQSNDALHLAIVALHTATEPVIMVTSDRSLQAAAEKKEVRCYNPEDEI